jgi:hypothetical protein
MMAWQTQAFADEFRATVEAIATRLEQIDERESAIPLAEGKWSAKQIIGHLIDSAANNHARFVRAQFSDDLVFPGYEQDAWVATQRYNEEPWSQLVKLWQYYNLHLAHVIDGTPEEVRLRPRVRHNLDKIAFKAVPVDQPVTLDYFMRDYVVHLQHHFQQILSKFP